jgi:hypothetical protein
MLSRRIAADASGVRRRGDAQLPKNGRSGTTIPGAISARFRSRSISMMRDLRSSSHSARIKPLQPL